jgi:hypothetical protein
MRSFLLSIGAAAALFVLPTEQASAGHYDSLHGVAHRYADAAELFHHGVARSRRASDYTVRLASRLACAAGDLDVAISRGAEPRRVAQLYDEVYVMHSRFNELIGHRCQRPDRILIAYWRPLDAAFERLVCEIEGCTVVCPLIRHHHHGDRPSAGRPPIHRDPWAGEGYGFGNRPGVPSYGFGPSPHFDPRFPQAGNQSGWFPGQQGATPFVEPDRGNRDNRRDGDVFSRDTERLRRDRSEQLRRASSPEEMRANVVRNLVNRLFD